MFLLLTFFLIRTIQIEKRIGRSIVLFGKEELATTKDIAAMLGIKEKTSSSLLFKAREQLAQSVREYIRRNGL